MDPSEQGSPPKHLRRPRYPPDAPVPDVSPGTDPSTGTLIQRCGETSRLGSDIRELCPLRARPQSGEATPVADSSDLSASLVSLPVIHESPPDRYRRDDAPRPAQIGLSTQSDQIPDHGLP